MEAVYEDRRSGEGDFLGLRMYITTHLYESFAALEMTGRAKEGDLPYTRNEMQEWLAIVAGGGLLGRGVFLNMFTLDTTIFGYLIAFAPSLLDKSIFVQQAYIDPSCRGSGRLLLRCVRLFRGWVQEKFEGASLSLQTNRPTAWKKLFEGVKTIVVTRVEV